MVIDGKLIINRDHFDGKMRNHTDLYSIIIDTLQTKGPLSRYAVSRIMRIIIVIAAEYIVFCIFCYCS